jgi:hypothetical protein
LCSFPSSSTALKYALLVCRYAENAPAAVTTAGSSSTLFYNGTLYDNTHANRRGVTALSWAKPKMEFAVEDDGFT